MQTWADIKNDSPSAEAENSFSRTIAKAISILFHPLIMPLLGLLFAFSSDSYISFISYEAKRLIAIVIVINTFALPIMMIPLFYRFGIIKSIQMHSHRERLMPLMFTLIPYIFTFYFLNRLPLPNYIASFLLGASVTIAIAFIVSIWWKISIHMVGIGGLAGFIFAFSLKLSSEEIVYLLIALGVTGIIAWSRLALNAHKPAQVYTGFGVGCFTMILAILLY